MRGIVCTIVTLLMGAVVLAVPAYRGPMKHVQSDGTELTLYQHGDESFHYFTNESGQWLQADENGDYRIIPALSEEQIRLRRAESGFATRELRRSPSATSATGVDRVLSPRGPVILVNYSDVQFKSTLSQMQNWAMGSGSVHDYFNDVSYGQYDLQLDVFGPVTLNKPCSYYGEDQGGEGQDAHANELVVEACKLAIAQGADFSEYDDDQDGYVDWVVIIFAGKGQADGGANYTIWPHQYDLHYSGSAFKLNGKTIDHYCILNELNGQTGNLVGIGTFVHEFSHIMGLPDFYETTGSGTWKTLGMWDIMDYGPYNNDGNTPPAYSAYERWFMGWLKPVLLKKTATVTLNDLNREKSAGYITERGQSISNSLRPYPTTFYMLENRQQKGWDTYLPGHGLLITKINYSYMGWCYNNVNNTSSKLGVDIVEADGYAPSYSKLNPDNGYFGKPSDAYPAGATSFTAVPAYQVTNITERGSRIIFDINGGGDPILIEESIEQTAASKKSSIKWLRNGQIVIQQGDELYTIQGNRIN